MKPRDIWLTRRNLNLGRMTDFLTCPAGPHLLTNRASQARGQQPAKTAFYHYWDSNFSQRWELPLFSRFRADSEGKERSKYIALIAVNHPNLALEFQSPGAGHNKN